jgi:molecular chaperone GrpE
MDAETSLTRISPEVRERMVRNFAAWLDRVVEDEKLPEGLPAELLTALQNEEALPPLEGTPSAGQGSDLYSLWSAMTTLAQEVRMQGRLFKQLNETVIQDLQSRNPPGEDTPPQPAAGDSKPETPGKQHIDLLLDLRDRMERGVGAARDAAAALAPSRLPRLARWLGAGSAYARHAQEILNALSHGYTLSLDRVDEALVASGIDRIACQDRMFDPQRMTAIDIDDTGGQPEGTVVAVYRDGYEWNGKIYRPAQVKVARKPGSKLQ